MKRRTVCQLMLAGGMIGLLPQIARAENSESIFAALRTRRSVRQYTGEPVSDADIRTMLACAMQAPSAKNEQPWEFVVIREPELLAQIAKASPNASFAKNAPLAILVCMDKTKQIIEGIGIIDTSMAAENLMLAARGLGLGSVFTAAWPIPERMETYAKLCNLPERVLPIGLIVIGHPREASDNREIDRYNQGAVHYDKWSD